MTGTTAPAERPYGGPPGGAGLAARIAADPDAPLAAAVVGPGGTGKTMLLGELAAAYGRAGVEVSRYPDTGAGPVLVDDAHQLTDADLDRLCRIAADPGARLVLAHRPWPRPRALAALTATLGPRRIVVMVGHLDRCAVADRIAERVGCPVPDAMAELVHEQTGGLPGLVDVVTHALCESGRFDPRRPDRFDRPDRITVSPAFAERLRHRVDALEPPVHDLLEALALGAAPDGEVLGALLAGSPALPDEQAIGNALEAAAATGLLRENGEPIPVMQELFCRLAPVLRRRELQRRLATIELDRGGSVLVAGRRLLGSGAGGERVGAVLEAAAAEALPDSPALAGELLDAAVAAGRPARALAARRARAAALAGDLDAALRHADPVLADPAAPDRGCAVETAAAVLAHRGMLAGSAQLYRSLSPTAALLGVPALVATGALADAVTTAAVAGVGPCSAAATIDARRPGGAAPTAAGLPAARAPGSPATPLIDHPWATDTAGTATGPTSGSPAAPQADGPLTTAGTAPGVATGSPATPLADGPRSTGTAGPTPGPASGSPAAPPADGPQTTAGTAASLAADSATPPANSPRTTDTTGTRPTSGSPAAPPADGPPSTVPAGPASGPAPGRRYTSPADGPGIVGLITGPGIGPAPGAPATPLTGGSRYTDASAGPAPGTLLAGAAALMAEGMIETVTGAAPAALSRLCRAAGLLEPVASGVLLPDTPAALTAVVALQCGELSVAADALRRAVEGRHGGRMAQLRHRLLYGWVLLDSGRAGAVARLLDRLSRPDVRLEPRDELVAAALGVAVARRAESPGALAATWARARDALVRHPVELSTLRELGELAVAAAAVGEADRLAAHLDEADRLLDRLGRPALWCAPLHWFRLQAAVAAGCPEQVERWSAALAGTAGSSPYASVLHAAGAAWSQLLAGVVEPDALIALGRRMQPVGLGWEAARLVAAAAPLVPERRAAAALHAFARGLGAVPDSPDEPAPAPTDDAPAFSERELEIGRLILAGLTYKQIGPRLYISAKTVEHHVARMRQRLGVASREELFDALRAALP